MSGYGGYDQGHYGGGGGGGGGYNQGGGGYGGGYQPPPHQPPQGYPRTVLPHPSSTITINIPDNTGEATIPMPHLAVLLPPITAAVAIATRLRRTRPLPD